MHRQVRLGAAVLALGAIVLFPGSTAHLGGQAPSGIVAMNCPSGVPKVSNTSCTVSRGMLPTSNSCSLTDVTCFPPAHTLIAMSRSVPGSTTSDFRSAATED